MSLAISAGKGPELPMQVVQPCPTNSNPSLSSAACNPDSARMPEAICEPGANDAFTRGLAISPCRNAFSANNPAATINRGLDVLVQLVMAAMTMSPFLRSSSRDTPAPEDGIGGTVVDTSCGVSF